MAVILGTNAGFVSEAPVADPAGSVATTDGYARATKHTSPAGCTKITEIGWWCDTADDEEANFEVAIYSHDVENNKPGDRLHVNNTNARGTTSGWKTVVVDWDITAETTYWIAFQLDSIAGTISTNMSSEGAPSRISWAVDSTLPDPWPASSELADYNIAVYALYKVNMAGTGGGVGGGSATLFVSGMLSDGAGVSRNYKRVVVASNDRIFFEDI